jgi:plastocyanin
MVANLRTRAARPYVVGLSISACLVPAGCGGSDDQPSAERERSAPPAAGPTTEVRLVALKGDKFRFAPRRLEVPAGRLAITLENPDNVFHNVRVATGGKCCFRPGSRDIGGTKTVGPGGEIRGTADVKRGEYVFYCSIAGHWNTGMVGSLTVK